VARLDGLIACPLFRAPLPFIVPDCPPLPFKSSMFIRV
jgi:hypothetical protein